MDVISPETNDLMTAQFAEGVQETAQDYADTIGEIPSVPTPVPDSSFFGVNERRMNSLLDDMQQIEKKVSSATLRMMDDVYRQTLHKAELAMAAGATTLPNAIDMAVQDFLSAGITCIEYKNGRRVNIADYAEMALRTAATRAKLQGDAAMRAQLGVDTVLVSQYGQCSETCLPWQGRVYIDDVFSVWNGERSGDLGKSNDGNWYTLLSIAVAHGLFHPNCRHTLTTWYKGTSTMPKPMNPAQIKKNAALEQQQRALERKLKRAKRLEIGSTDPESIKKYSDRRKAAQRELHSFVADHSDILRRDPWKEKVQDVRAESVLENKFDFSQPFGIINHIPTDGTEKKIEARVLGNLDISRLQDTFGKIRTDEVIITDERIKHIKTRHPEDYELFERYGIQAIQHPDVIIQDTSNVGTAFFIKQLADTNLNVVLRLVLDTDNPDYKNSVMTFYRIRERGIKGLLKKHKLLYTRE